MDANTNELMRLIRTIHEGCIGVIKDALGRKLPVAGNMGVFCQNDADYKRFQLASMSLTKPSDNPAQKHFELRKPLTFPEGTYSFLYIRKPAADSPEYGDVDFILEPREFENLKKRVGEGWDMVEIRSPIIRALAYVSTREMAEKVRVRFD